MGEERADGRGITRRLRNRTKRREVDPLAFFVSSLPGMCAAAALLAGLNELAANFLRHYPQYKNGAFNLTELARLCDISRTTAYKYIGLLER